MSFKKKKQIQIRILSSREKTDPGPTVKDKPDPTTLEKTRIRNPVQIKPDKKHFVSGIHAVQIALTTEKGKIKFDPDILGNQKRNLQKNVPPPMARPLRERGGDARMLNGLAISERYFFVAYQNETEVIAKFN